MSDLEDERSLYHQCKHKEKFKKIIRKLEVVAN